MGRIHTQALRRITKIGKGVYFFTQLTHILRRHHNLLTHHIFKRQHHFVGVYFKNARYKILVSLGMPLFVGRYHAANLRQHGIARLLGQGGYAAVRNIRSYFLKTGVHKGAIRIVVGFNIKTISNQHLCRGFKLAHINTLAQIQITVQYIAVAVFFGRPPTNPTHPWVRFALVNPVHRTQPCFIRR